LCVGLGTAKEIIREPIPLTHIRLLAVPLISQIHAAAFVPVNIYQPRLGGTAAIYMRAAKPDNYVAVGEQQDL